MLFSLVLSNVEIFMFENANCTALLRKHVWVIQGREHLPRIILVGIHFEVKASSAVTKSDQSSSTDLFEWLSRNFF